MFDLVRPITFDTSQFLSMTDKHSISSLPAILVLEDTKVHIFISHDSNVTSYIESIVNQSLS